MKRSRLLKRGTVDHPEIIIRLFARVLLILLILLNGNQTLTSLKP
jgi:hypothetical protein